MRSVAVKTRNTCGTLEPGSKQRHVGRPGETFPLLARELHLDDDAQHGLAIGLAIAQQDNRVCTVLGRLDVGQLGRFDPRLRESRQRHLQHTQKLRGQLRAVTE
jgi:hypothetical protein